MKSVKESSNTIIIKNSRFITYIYHVDNVDEVNEYLTEIKKKYPDATHHCYAYIIDSIRHESDDGEPSGTAGIPMLQVLEKNDLNHVLCIVVRYFGKIKLGAGGLVRAYTRSVVEAIKDNIVTLEAGYLVSLEFDYSLLKKIDYLLKDIEIVNKSFDNIIIYQAKIDDDLKNKLNDTSNIKIEVLDNIYINKKE